MNDTYTTCPSCDSPEVLSVNFTLEASLFTFSTCNSCEWKGWERGGENLPLGKVLAAVSSR